VRSKAKTIAERRTRLAIATLILTLIAGAAGCQKSAVEPVAIAAEDICGYCRMAISEKQYAAEFVDRDGQAFKFDDIGCMIEHLKTRKNRADIAAYFVADFESRSWLKAEDAALVRSKELKTPMGFGIVAFKDREKADQAAGAYHGTVAMFAELIES
jgi:copper chaperone NosL